MRVIGVSALAPGTPRSGGAAGVKYPRPRVVAGLALGRGARGEEDASAKEEEAGEAAGGGADPDSPRLAPPSERIEQLVDLRLHLPPEELMREPLEHLQTERDSGRVYERSGSVPIGQNGVGCVRLASSLAPMQCPRST